MTAPTQEDIVLEWLLLGLPITQYEANYNPRIGVSRLPAIIHKLENKRGFKGWINHEDIQVKNRFGKSTTVTRYSL